MSKVSMEHIRVSYGSHTVLKDFSLTVEPGEIVGIVGPSGCGKTTAIRALCGFLNPEMGEITVNGRTVFSKKERVNVPPENRKIGIVFQDYAVWPHMSVYDNVAYPLKKRKVPKAEIAKRVSYALEQSHMTGYENYMPSQLSGGQQQRVALARAIVTGPKVLLLDEPLSAIDAKLRHSLQIEIRRIQKEFNMTTIFVTHDQDEAMVMSDEIHLFHDGRIEQSGTPTEMYTAPRTRFAAGFIGSYNIFTAAEFKKLCGEDTDAPDVAIRPEVVRLNYETSAPAPRYYAKGTIVNSLSHGNLVRYTVRCHDIDINSDVMFEKHSLLEVGEEVEVSIRKTNVIMLY